MDSAAAPGPDIQTWDLARILTEIDRHFTAALADEKALKSTPVTDYNGLLTSGNVPDSYRPTMFDFLAYEALQFYQAGEYAALRSEDEFELDAASPIFADVDGFAQWQPSDNASGRPEAAAASSPVLKAIRLYQSLLQFHQGDADRSAFLDADLGRLTYGHNVAIGEDKTNRYMAALERFIVGRPVPGLVGGGGAHAAQLPRWIHEMNPSRDLCNRATSHIQFWWRPD